MRQGPVAITTSSSKCCAGDAFYANKSWPKPMTSYFAEIVNFVGAHPHYALTAVFLLALSKAIPVIGTVVPGSTLLVGISALATGADVNPWFLLVAATGGAIAGDGVSFWLGQRYHQEFLLGWSLNRYPQFIGRSEAFTTYPPDNCRADRGVGRRLGNTLLLEQASSASQAP